MPKFNLTLFLLFALSTFGLSQETGQSQNSVSDSIAPIPLMDFGQYRKPDFCYSSPNTNFGCFIETGSATHIHSTPAALRIQYNLQIGQYGGWGIDLRPTGDIHGARYLSFWVFTNGNHNFEIKAKDTNGVEAVVYSYLYFDNNITGWQEVKVPLTDFSSRGVSLLNLENFSLGINFSLTGNGQKHIWVDDFYLKF